MVNTLEREYLKLKTFIDSAKEKLEWYESIFERNENALKGMKESVLRNETCSENLEKQIIDNKKKVSDAREDINDMRHSISLIDGIGQRLDKADDTFAELQMVCKSIKDCIPPSAENMFKDMKAL